MSVGTCVSTSSSTLQTEKSRVSFFSSYKYLNLNINNSNTGERRKVRRNKSRRNKRRRKRRRRQK
jgi:hypothetical protein